jgi:DNA-binding XRE family transcriptional regulator
MKEFNEKLKLLRKTEDYTQKEMAKLLEIDPTNYQRYEYGKVLPNYKIVKKLCSAFPEYSQWLMTDDDEYMPQVDPHIKEEAKDEVGKVV